MTEAREVPNTDPRILGLRDLNLPLAAFHTTAQAQKEVLVTDWIDRQEWRHGGDDLPHGLIVCDGSNAVSRDLAWYLLMKEVFLSGNYVARTTHLEIAIHARHTDPTPHQVVASMLGKMNYPIDEEPHDGAFNTLQRFCGHVFIEHLDKVVSNDRMVRVFVEESILLLAYYTSVYIRVPDLPALADMFGPEFVAKLKGGQIAKLGVWE